MPQWISASVETTFGTPAGPTVGYPVFGTDDTVTYLARSMVAQEQEIDLTYLQASGGDVSAKVRAAMVEVGLRLQKVLGGLVDLEVQRGRG